MSIVNSELNTGISMRAIYIPLIERELDDLFFLSLAWRVFAPFEKNASIDYDLVISFDRDVSESVSESCLKLFSEFGFKNVLLLSARLEDNEAVYIRSSIEAVDTPVPKYGFKSGPNKHFLFNLRKMKSLGYEAVLQCETDMFPLKSNWVEDIFNSVDTSKVVSGPIYRGPTTLGGNIAQHVNGNSIYNVSHPKFDIWIDFLECCIIYLISHRNVTGTAFDTSFFEVLSLYIKEGWSKTIGKIQCRFVRCEDDFRSLLELYHYNNKILNFSGGIEASDDYVFDLDVVLNGFGSVPYLIHSPHARYFIAAKILELNVCSKRKRLERYFSSRLFPAEKREKCILKYVKSSDYINRTYISSYLNPFSWRF